MTRRRLSPAIAAAVKRWDDEPPPPPLSEHQKDVIAAAFRGALRKTAPPGSPIPGGAHAMDRPTREADRIGQGRTIDG